jgi:hypothetical protein
MYGAGNGGSGRNGSVLGGLGLTSYGPIYRMAQRYNEADVWVSGCDIIG